jgi:hypothetical protein
MKKRERRKEEPQFGERKKKRKPTVTRITAAANSNQNYFK